MGLFKSEVAQGAAKVIDSVTELIDRNITSKEEKGEIFLKLEDAKAEISELIENNVTERHANDMKSDNKLSKNIRPLTMIFILSCFFVMIVSNILFKTIIPDTYVDLLKFWGGLVFAFYFGFRSLEKGVSLTDVFSRKNRNLK